MGLFDIASPLVFAADDALTPLPGLVRLLMWALLTGLVGMAVYRFTSPQRKLKTLKVKVKDSRRAMMDFDGDADEMWPVLAASLSSSLQHLGLTFGGALLAGLPVLLLISPIAQRYGYDQPTPGTPIQFEISEPAASQWEWQDPTGRLPFQPDANGAGERLWPEAGTQAQLLADGQPTVSLPLHPGSAVVHKRFWWNTLFENPAGYLPQDAPLSAIRFELPSQQFLSFGPGWMRGWAFSFFVALIGFSLIFKIWWNVE